MPRGARSGSGGAQASGRKRTRARDDALHTFQHDRFVQRPLSRRTAATRRSALIPAMIITQTPLRISIAGGGTDLPDYYRRRGGFVVSTAIDKYVYVIVKERYDDKIYVDYSSKEIVDSVDDIQHELVREAAKLAGMGNGFEVAMMADIPSEG